MKLSAPFRGVMQKNPYSELWRTSFALEQRARHEASAEAWLSRVGGACPPSPPQVHLGPLAAGAKVVASTQEATAALLTSIYGDAQAVEMDFKSVPELNRMAKKLRS